MAMKRTFFGFAGREAMAPSPAMKPRSTQPSKQLGKQVHFDKHVLETAIARSEYAHPLRVFSYKYFEVVESTLEMECLQETAWSWLARRPTKVKI